MKRLSNIFLLICAMIPAISAFGGNCRIAFNTEGLKADTIKIMAINFFKPSEILNLSAPVIDDMATFDLSSDATNLIVADFFDADRRVRGNIRTVVIPDCPMSICVSDSDHTIGGASEYISIERARKAIGADKMTVSDSIYSEKIKDYIANNPDDIGAAFVACDLGADILCVDSLISENAKAKLHGYYDYFIEKYETPLILQRIASRIEVGTPAPDFTLTDINGHEFSLSSLSGKPVIIDFWGSWCIPCLKSIPRLKEQYELYKDKGLEIVSIACSDTDDAWRAAVARNSINWINLINDGRDDDVALTYGITAFPTMFIIDKDGVIAAKTTGENDEFFSTLKHLFN